MSRFSQNKYFDENRGSPDFIADPRRSRDSISRNEKSGHIPVLLDEVIENLNPKPGQKFIDATIDGGGHAFAILERITPSGRLLGVEWDGELLKQLKLKVQSSGFKDDTILVNDSYANLEKIAEADGFTEADGILFDLGMSSWHLEEAGRGFSFTKDEPLNMAYATTGYQLPTPGRKQTAEEIVNRCSYDELVKILKEYGEERFAKSIAANIVKTRKEKPIRTTFELVEIIKNSTPFWYRSAHRRSRIHFATKTFQALRIAVNDELENIKSGVKQAENILKSDGRLAVISFHSLEDGIIKNFFREENKEGKLRILTKKPIQAKLAEITANPRARSAKLRVAEKI